MTTKILLIGRAGMGKTSIKQVVFEGKDPQKLILFQLKPTRGIISSVYSWMDLNLGVFDTSGQELPYLLEDENECRKAFDKSSAIFYIFDYIVWTTQFEDIIEEIQKIFNISKNYMIGSKFILLFHKIDLINQKVRDNFQLIKNQIIKQVNLPIELQVFFTSLHPKLIYNTFNAFFEILSSFSKETSNLKSIIDTIIKDFPKTLCAITNLENRVVVQTITNDIDTRFINQLYSRVSQFNDSSTLLTQSYNTFQILDLDSKIGGMIIDNLELSEFHLKEVICISEDLNVDKLLELIGKLKSKINNYYKSNKLK